MLIICWHKDHFIL